MDFNGILALIIILALTVGLFFRQLTKWRDSESTLRTDDASGEENEVLRRDLESTLRMDREEKKASRRDSESTSRTDDQPTSRMDNVSREENEELRRDSESTSRKEDLITSKTDDASGEENKALRRDSESNSRMDSASKEEYDVFLSFRGSDTRLNFTDHLYCSMVRAGIRVFLDSEELKVGKNISEVLNALNKSRIYIPIFSQKFASSVWCLREVERMVERHLKSNGKKEIIPIFYDVKTDDVKLRTDLYNNAIIEHKKSDPDEVEQWRNALKTVGKIIGLELQGKRQAEQIESIVEEVSCKLNTRHMIETENLVEDGPQVKAIMKLLDVGSNGVRFVGIHGTGGVGKTTLAKVLFNKLSFHFDGYCFLEDIRASSQPHDGLLNLQRKLLSGFVGSRITDQIKDVGGGIKRIKDVFGNKKLLIVLDDLDKKEQLQYLAGKSDWFGFGSRIIITTREESILNTQIDQSKGIFPHEVRGMGLDLALRLFNKHAFRSDYAVKEYEESSREIVLKVGMLPLAVVVIGSHLFDLGNHLRNLDKREFWDETLEKLEVGLFDDVRDTLMISYERLTDIEKEVFLDIACFFTNEDRTYPVIMWKDCGYRPHTALGVLSHRSLVKIRDDNSFWMHDQVRDFGRDIVLREYPRKICRVWISEKALELLEAKKRNENVKALSLMFDGHSFTQKELACLPNLRFLRVKESDFSGNFKNLVSELRWLSWQTRGTTFRANNFHFSKLIVLDLSDSDIEDGWGGWRQMKVMGKLKVLDLTGCTKLTRTPDFSNFMSLEMLLLARCPKLITIDRSIGELKYLKTLNIKGCSSLRELPEEVGSLHSLTEIVMPQNFQPLKLPERFGELKSLLRFILDGHPRASQLPKSIGKLVELTHLSLGGCVSITELPSSIGELQMLEELDVSKSGIVTLPDSIGKLKKLRMMKISYTLIIKFPHTIGEVEMLEELYARKCWCLTDEHLEKIGNLSHLKILDLSYTYVRSLPEVIGRLSHLQKLQIGSIVLEQVTDLPLNLTSLQLQAIDFSFIRDLSSLNKLKYLEFHRLSAILKKEPYSGWRNDPPEMEKAYGKEQPVHQLPSHLSALKLNGISPLPQFSNLESLTILRVWECPLPCLPVFEGLRHLWELEISRCERLQHIPDLSCLKNLQRLVLKSLNSLLKIPDLSKLKSLQFLHLSRCPLIEELPNLSKFDKLQHLEVESCPMLRPIEGVEGLDTHGRTVLERMSDGSRTTWLSHKLPMYDVFLSFRGPDTRYSIISFLHKSFLSGRISFFRDDDELSPGEGIGEEIQQALDNSRIYIPIFSTNYASSQWCLRELVRMVKFTSESNDERRILPIFYDVEIDDVKLKSNLYKSVLDEHRKNFPDEVRAWEVALKKVALIKGFDLKTNSAEDIVQKIIAEVLRAKKLLDVDS